MIAGSCLFLILIWQEGSECVYVWHALTGKVTKGLMPSTHVALAIFSDNGLQIVSASEGRSLRVWDFSTSQTLDLLGGHSDKVTSVTCFTDSRRIVSGSIDGSVRVWDLTARPRYIQEHDCSAFAGWLLSTTGEGYLMFVPLDATLPASCQTFTLLRSFPVSCVDFSRAKLDSQWHECYQP